MAHLHYRTLVQTRILIASPMATLHYVEHYVHIAQTRIPTSYKECRTVLQHSLLPISV